MAGLGYLHVRAATYRRILDYIRANSSKPDSSDSVADFGERWNIKSGPTMNKTIDIHHASADWMFIQPVQETKSALDLIFDSINGFFGQ